MNLANQIVFITGASAGIGKACAEKFAEAGAKLIISARRNENVNRIADEIRKKFGTEFLTFKLDVKNRNEVMRLVASLPDEWKKIDILINNAGLVRGFNKLQEDNPEGCDEMIDTNIKGLLNVTYAIAGGMAERKEGHIINIGSIAGTEAYSNGSVYCATKHAVHAISQSLRLDLLDKGIRVSEVQPGMVETEFSKVRFYGDEEKAKYVYRGMTPLSADDVAEAVLFIAQRPKHVSIQELRILPTSQATATLVYRKE